MIRISSLLTILATLISLLGFIPLFPYLEFIPRLVFPLALLCGIWLDLRSKVIPSFITTSASIVFFVYYATRFSRDNLASPAVSLLALLLATRLISEKNSRNYLQIFALSLFSLAGSSLFDLSASFLVFLIALLFMVAIAMVLLTFYETEKDPLLTRQGLFRITAAALVMPSATLPLMLIFFLIMPRTQVPMWDFLNSAGKKRGGVSDRVQPGSSSSAIDSKTVAFRATCERVAATGPYWRCVVLNTFTGSAWERNAPPQGERCVAPGSQMIRPTIYPEPGLSRYLPTLNAPRQLVGTRATMAGDLVYSANTAPGGRIRYETISAITDHLTVAGGIKRDFYLMLPADDSRLVAKGRELGAKGSSDGKKLALVEEYFRSQHLMYARSGLPTGPKPLETFLFDRKRGHCEFFASSCAVLLRGAGVPARLVGGYYGGEYNELGGYYVVTEEMAHVWVEAYLDGKGWVLVDPSGWAVNGAELGGSSRLGGMKRLQLVVDAFGYYWNQMVINYDLERQIQMINAANARFRGLTLSFRPIYALVGVATLLLTGGIFIFMRLKRISREERVLRAFYRRLGLSFPAEGVAAIGLYELAAKQDDLRVHEFVRIYGEAVYRDRLLTDDELVRLRDILKNLGR